MKVLSQDEVTNVQGGAFVNNFSIPNLGLPNFRFDKFNPHLSGVGGGGKLNIPNFGNIRDGGGSIGATGVLSGLGSRLGFPGFVTGAAVGYLIDSTDFNALGENYKRDIMSEIQKGNIPTD